MSKFLTKFKEIIGLREVLFIAGLLLLAYGLYLFRPWVSFSITGCILLAVGFFLKDS